MRPALLAVLALALHGPALAQERPRCAASGWDTLRDAEQVINDVKRHGCAPDSRLDVAMTNPGQAIALQMSGICDRESVRTRTVRPTPETRALGFRCDLAAR
jgi:hypothetical protein